MLWVHDNFAEDSAQPGYAKFSRLPGHSPFFCSEEVAIFGGKSRNQAKTIPEPNISPNLHQKLENKVFLDKVISPGGLRASIYR